MPPLSSLPPPQRAVLALVLEKGKSYADIAVLLRLDLDAVGERAHQAFDALSPADGAPPPVRRAAIGDYLLGQDPDGAPDTIAYLERSRPARDWAGALAQELAPLAGAPLPAIPNDAPASAPAPPGDAPPSAPAGREGRSQAPAVSRRGGAVLIAGALAAIAAAVAGVLVLGGGGSSPRHAASRPRVSPPASTTATATAPTASVAGQITLTAAAGLKVRGLAAVIQRGSQRALAIAASGLQPTSARRAYGVWLYNTRADSQLIGFVPPVKADGKVSAAAALPTSAARYHRLVLTVEAGPQARAPGQILLSGAIPANAVG